MLPKRQKKRPKSSANTVSIEFRSILQNFSCLIEILKNVFLSKFGLFGTHKVKNPSSSSRQSLKKVSLAFQSPSSDKRGYSFISCLKNLLTKTF